MLFFKEKRSCITIKSKKVISLTLASMIGASILTGCSKSDKNDIIQTIPPTTSISTDADADADADSNLLESSNPTFKRLLDLYYSNGDNYSDVLSSENSNEELRNSALYVYLRECGLKDQEIITYLENMAVTSVASIGLDELNWDLLFGELYSTVNNNENVVKTYYSLAKELHLDNCNEEHTIVENNFITCNELERKLFDEYNENVLFANYMINEIKSSGDKNLISKLNRILNSDVDVVKCMKQLDNVYGLAIIPRCLSEEEWYDNFSELLKTVDVRENVVEVYYDLAFAIHTYDCFEDHYENEFGVNECKTYRLKYNEE